MQVILSSCGTYKTAAYVRYTKNMKERFENVLHSQSAREEGSEFETKYQEDISFIEGLVDDGTLEKIKALQDQKLDFVDGLRAWRKKFWNDSATKIEQHQAQQFESQAGAWALQQIDDTTFRTHMKGGDVLTLTKGEVMAAAQWGFWWRFDDSVDNSLQREVMSHQVRHVIAGEYDKQLIALGKADRLSNDMKRDVYTSIEATNLNLDTMPAGILCEKMLMSFLTKEMHDSDLPFKVQSVDVYEDVENKIDFVVTFEGTTRGVQVGEPEHTNRIGIQFTMNAHAAERKEKQLEKVRGRGFNNLDIDELVLIVMPLNDVKKKYQQWRYDESGNRRNERKLDPNGPDSLWSEDTKKQIIDGLVRGIKDAHA